MELDSLSCDRPTDDDFSQIVQLKNLRMVVFKNGELSGTAVAALEQMPSLEQVTLGHFGVDDHSIWRLAGLRDLKVLHLPYSDLTDEGLARLADLFPALEELGLCHTRITNAGLRSLSRFPNLVDVLLCGNNFTRDGLRYLQDSRGLREITLAETSIERAAAGEFARKMQGCDVFWIDRLTGGHVEPLSRAHDPGQFSLPVVRRTQRSIFDRYDLDGPPGPIVVEVDEWEAPHRYARNAGSLGR